MLTVRSPILVTMTGRPSPRRCDRRTPSTRSGASLTQEQCSGRSAEQPSGALCNDMLHNDAGVRLQFYTEATSTMYLPRCGQPAITPESERERRQTCPLSATTPRSRMTTVYLSTHLGCNLTSLWPS